MTASFSSFSDLLETKPCRYGVITYFKSDQVIGRSLREYGEWAQYEIDFLLNFIREGDTVVDVGSFIGTHTLAFAKYVGKSGFVYAFEPNPLAYKVLEMNIQQNNLTNVRLFNIALSDEEGTVYVSRFSQELASNPGAFSLVTKEGKNSTHGIEIKTARLDDLKIQQCRLIKIDVERMESKVIVGAGQLLDYLRPLVYMECLSMEDGARIISIMKKKGYEPFVHSVPAFNPNNFRKNDINFFGMSRDLNIFFVPSEEVLLLCLQSPKFKELVHVSTLDDLVLMLLHKPQYKDEVLVKTEAASVIGNKFWANEPELQRLQVRLEEQEQEIQALQGQLAKVQAYLEAERVARKDLEEESGRLAQQLVELSLEREQAIAQVQAQLQESAQERERLTQHAQALQAQLAAVQAQAEAERATLTQQVAEKEQAMQQLQAQLAEREQAIAQVQAQLRTEREQLTQQVAEKEQAIQQLQAQLTEQQQALQQLQTQLVSLQQRLSWKRYRFADRLLSYYWYLWHPKQAWQRAKARAWELGRRWLPTFIKRLIKQAILRRSTEYQKQRVQNAESQDNSLKTGLIFNIDSLRANKNRIYGWGWLFHKEYSIKSLTSLVKVKNSWYSIPCQYGLAREDVAHQYPFPNAKYSGFIISGRLPAHATPEQFSLEVRFPHGAVYRLEIPDALKQLEIPLRIQGRLAKIRRWIKATLKYFARRDFKGWLEAVRRKIQTATHPDHPRAAFDLGQLLSIAGRDAHFSLIIDHKLGGGANLYRQRLIQEKRQSHHILMMLYDLPNLEYQLQYLYRDDEQSCRIESLDSLAELAKKAQIEEIFLNNLVSFDEPLLVAQWCLYLKRLTGAKLTIPIHDYFSICPSYTLLDDRSQFCGIPAVSRCRECLRNHKGVEFLSLVNYRDIDTWRSIWGELLTAADRILCFSQSSVGLLQRAYPKLDLAKVTIQPHSVEPLRKVRIKLGAPLHIGVVGHIYSEAKGAHIMREMVKIIEEQQLPVRVTVIGTMETPLLSSVLRVTGQYKREDLPDIIESSGANIFFLPSVWPETFSYVTGELMQMEVPLAVFDLGAQAEFVRRYNLGLVIPKIDAAYALKALVDFHSKLRNQLRDTIASEMVQKGS